jgi:hypothetical protein
MLVSKPTTIDEKRVSLQEEGFEFHTIHCMALLPFMIVRTVKCIRLIYLSHKHQGGDLSTSFFIFRNIE